MSWNFTMGLISTVSLFLPIALIIALRLSTYRSFPYLLGYYVFVFAYNLFTEGYINPATGVIYYWGLMNNLLDAPLMLSFLTYFSTSVSFTRKMRIVALILLAFDALVVIWGGFNASILTVVLAPGLVAILTFCLIFFAFPQNSCLLCVLLSSTYIQMGPLHVPPDRHKTCLQLALPWLLPHQ